MALSANAYEGNQSFCLSRAFAEETGISSTFDLARPEIAKLMDGGGNGKGEIWIGAPGWASANVNEVKVRDYGLLPYMEPVRADQSVMTANVGDSIEKEIGYAFYCYSPHAFWFPHDIVTLSEPEFDAEQYVVLQPDEDPADVTKALLSQRAHRDGVPELRVDTAPLGRRQHRHATRDSRGRQESPNCGGRASHRSGRTCALG